MYISRDLEKKILPFLSRKEIIAIFGPRQAGKTTFLHYLEKKLQTDGKKVVFITFEERSKLELFQNQLEDFKRLFAQYDYIIIDEFQYAKDGGQKLKYLFDTTDNKFIISGSSSLELTYATGKYLVGRILNFSLYPFSFREFLSIRDKELHTLLERNIKPIDLLTFDLKNGFGEVINQKLAKYLEEYVTYGGYPAVVLSETELEKQKILASIVDNYLLRDIKGLLHLATEDNLLNLSKFLAGQIGNIVKYQELSNVCQLPYHDLKKHLNILEKTFIINLIKPFFTNRRTELTKNPKVYFTDLGLRNYLLSDWRSFPLRPDSGAIIENYAFNLITSLEISPLLKFWRTKSQAEVDFILESHQEIYPLEVKSSFKDTVGKSIYSFIDKFKPKTVIILTKAELGQREVGQTNIQFIPMTYF